MTTSTPEARLIDEESALCELFFSKRNIDAAVQLAATPPPFRCLNEKRGAEAAALESRFTAETA